MAIINDSQEAKWKRMKHHIAKSARRLGKKGDEFARYVYGAMRARGWRPKRERVTESLHAMLRPNTDTNYGHAAQHQGSRSLEFKDPAHKRPSVQRYSIPQMQAQRQRTMAQVRKQVISDAYEWLNEVYATDIVPTNLPQSEIMDRVFHKGRKSFEREMIHPYRNTRRAVRVLKKAGVKGGHASVQRRRALAVIINRMPPMAAGVAGAGAAAVIPGPQGGGLLAAAVPAGATRIGLQQSRKAVKWLRRR